MIRCKPSGALKAVSGRARLAVLAVGLLLGVQGAWAACTVTPGYQEKMLNMFIGPVVVSNDATVGQLITPVRRFQVPLTGPSNQPWVCVGGGTVIGQMLQGTEVPGYDRVFTTDVAGIGIRLSRFFGPGTGGTNPPESEYYPHTRTTPSTFGNFTSQSYFQVELFKIAAVTGNGPLAQGTYTRYYSPADNKSVLTTFLTANSITIITPSCTVDTGSRNISVQLGKVPQSDFKGVGTTAGDRNFNIRLNCKAGQNAQNTVYLRMDAQPDPSNVQGVLQLTQGGTGTASGVGIQVLDAKNTTPVKFGDDALVGPSMGGSYVLPYTARYYQTTNKVTPGRADGTATFTIEYK